MANFDRIAVFYDFLKGLIFGSQLQKASDYFLKGIPANSQILIVGGGTGQLLTNFESSHQITYLELSARMISRAKKVKSKASVNFVQEDILEWESDRKFDFVITPFILDCFTDDHLNLIYPKLRRALNVLGKWIQTDFYPKSHLQIFLIKIMYSFFRMSTGLQTNKLADFDKLFQKHGFICTGKACFFHSMVESKIYQNIE
jgi:ubiquinone/menaquinone biosynthesis C-methylase UbiE